MVRLSSTRLSVHQKTSFVPQKKKARPKTPDLRLFQELQPISSRLPPVLCSLTPQRDLFLAERERDKKKRAEKRTEQDDKGSSSDDLKPPTEAVQRLYEDNLLDIFFAHAWRQQRVRTLRLRRGVDRVHLPSLVDPALPATSIRLRYPKRIRGPRPGGLSSNPSAQEVGEDPSAAYLRACAELMVLPKMPAGIINYMYGASVQFAEEAQLGGMAKLQTAAAGNLNLRGDIHLEQANLAKSTLGTWKGLKSMFGKASMPEQYQKEAEEKEAKQKKAAAADADGHPINVEERTLTAILDLECSGLADKGLAAWRTALFQPGDRISTQKWSVELNQKGKYKFVAPSASDHIPGHLNAPQATRLRVLRLGMNELGDRALAAFFLEFSVTRICDLCVMCITLARR